MNWPGIPELVVIAIIILLLFGGSKLKDIMKSFGEGLREFRKATSEASEELHKSIEPETGRDAEPGDLTDEQKKQGPTG